MKCLLHIGTEKTGTTLLQDWLYANQQELGKQRIYLSELLEKTNNRRFPIYFHQELDSWAEARGIKSVEEKNAFFKHFERDLGAEIKEASRHHDLFVISSEHLHSRTRTPEEIGAIEEFLSRHFDEVTVICYFRHQADMAVSLYSTALKVSNDRSLDWFLNWQVRPENYYFDFKAIAYNWSNAFGREHCNFRIYDRKRFVEQDIRKDFLAQMDLPIDSARLDFSVTSSNESLMRLSGAAYRKVNEIVPWLDEIHGGQSVLNTRLKDALAEVEQLRHGIMRSDVADEIDERFADINKGFFATYFPAEPGFERAPQREQADVHFDLDAVETLVGDVLEPVLRELHALEWRALGDKDADVLRDMALAIEKGESLDIRAASYLMSMAERARPEGKYIAIKAREFRQQLGAALDHKVVDLPAGTQLGLNVADWSQSLSDKLRRAVGNREAS